MIDDKKENKSSDKAVLLVTFLDLNACNNNNYYKKKWQVNFTFDKKKKKRSGIQQRRNSFEDGVLGTTCPIPPGRNFTYIMQVKDQIGSFYYFPSDAFHKAAGGFGGIRILSRPRIPVPFPDPAGDYTVLIGDWYKSNHTVRVSFLFYIMQIESNS